MAKEIGSKAVKIIELAPIQGREEIGQSRMDLGIEKEKDVHGIGMGVLSDGTPYLNQRGLAALCGVMNAHIGTISSQWDDDKPRIKSIKAVLAKMESSVDRPHYEVTHSGRTHFCYPADVCLAVLEYYAFDAGTNCQPEARDNFRLLAGTKLREMIFSQVGYDPTGQKRFDKWHQRISLNHLSAPSGFFSVFNEAHTIIYEMILAGAAIDEKTVVDISIGSHWSKYWEKENLSSLYGQRLQYPHRYPSDHPQALSNPQTAWCYPLAGLGAYREWLQNHYIAGGKFRTYLSGKAKKGDIAPSIAQLAIVAIEAPQLARPS